MKRTIIAAIAAAQVIGGLATAATASAANAETVAQFTAVVNEMAAKYNTGPIAVTVGPPIPWGSAPVEQMAAQANRGGDIRLNERWAAMDPNEFAAATAPNQANGFQPGGCEGIRSVAIHETGHILEQRKLLAGNNRRVVALDAIRSGQIVEQPGNMHGAAYLPDGQIEVIEAFGVAFQAVECGSATPTEQQFFDIMMG